MPCRDYDDRDLLHMARMEADQIKKKLDKVTRLLCGSLTHLRDSHLSNRQAYSMLLNNVPGLQTWWTEHQEQDRKRKEAERSAKAASFKRKREEIEQLQIKLHKLKKEIGE